MSKTIKLEGQETRILDLGMFTCTPTASAPPKFLIRGTTLDRLRSILSPVAAKPATSLVLPMSPETAVQLAISILRAAQQASIPLPQEVSLQTSKA